MVQLPRERFTPHRTCGGQMGPAHKARDDGDCYVRSPPLTDLPSVRFRGGAVNVRRSAWVSFSFPTLVGPWLPASFEARSGARTSG
ncbi:hypothetical protein EIB18_05115 [Caulobacter vibrioides]|nr:hypothetical protein CA608_04880 [Caulobacter vibrioides]AZH12145.1 hypothetical protein EIB18_05115 [Caulobacter vibrioides]PLR15883.1 hypothetical protein CVUC_01905 [Caulobacter vibrioides]